MKHAQRYLLAKYVPDVRRMEPVNIGVVLWCAGRTAARFLPVEEVAGLVNDDKTYRRWLTFWQGLLTQPAIEPHRGEPIPKDRPEFLDAFAKTQKGNYLLVAGGEITDRVPAKQMDKAAEQLFNELVSRDRITPSQREQRARLRAICSRLFKEAGIDGRRDFRRSVSVPCRMRNLEWHFTFDYAVANGSLNAVFQRVQLPAVQSVNSATLMFEQVQANHGLTPGRCAAIVQAGQQNVPDRDAAESLAMLREFATIIDVADYDAAVSQVAEIAGEPSPH